MYEVTCTLSRERLLALYLVKQTMPASRIKEMKVERGRWQRAAEGALREGPLWISWNQASAEYVLSVCAITEMVRSDLTENCSEVEADALSCQAQSHDETPRRQGTHLHVSPGALPEPPPFSSWAALRLRDFFLCMVRSPVMASGEAAPCTDTCRAGTVRGAVEGTEGAAAVSYSLPG